MKYLHPFDHLCVDLVTSPIVSNIDAKYFFLLTIDDCIKCIWLFFKKTKDDIQTYFTRYMNMIERNFEVKIKVVQSDSGKEFSFFIITLGALEVTHRITCPHSPTQNGRMKS